MYTKDFKPDKFSNRAQEKLAEVVWEPGTHEALCGFPEGARQNLGYYLYLVQKGEMPPDSSTVPGVPGVFELRDDDERAWYRLIHYKRVGDAIYVLHCFQKKSNKIEKKDLTTIRVRLGALKRRLAKETHDAGRQPAEKSDQGKRSG
jgi:phage-related protein